MATSAQLLISWEVQQTIISLTELDDVKLNQERYNYKYLNSPELCRNNICCEGIRP